MKNKLEKILTGIILIAGATAFGWMGYDTLTSRVQIEREAKERGVSVYEVCKEKGRSDVVDMLEIEEGIKNLDYVYTGDAVIPVYRSSTQPARK